MEDYKLYELAVEKNIERNEKYLEEFELWLSERSLGERTIRKHLDNIDLYIRHLAKLNI